MGESRDLINTRQREVVKAAVRLSHSQEALLLAIQLHLNLVQFLDLLVVPLCLVAHQRAIEVYGERHKDHHHWDHDDGAGQCSLPAAVLMQRLHGRRVGCGGAQGVCLRVYRQELDPAEEHHLCQKQQDAQGCGETPGQLNVVMHALVGRLADRVQVVDVADGFYVWQDTGADEQSEKVHRHQHGGANAEGNKELMRVTVLILQLHLHHGHL